MTKKLLMVLNTDYALMSHRIDLAINAKKEGFEVHIACCVTDYKEQIENYGFVLHNIKLSRSGLNIFKEFLVFMRILFLLRKLSPIAIHFITIKPIVYGGIASRILRLQGVIFAISGLGFVFSSNQLKAKLIKIIIEPLYTFIFKGRNAKIILQNNTDANYLVNKKILKKEKIVLIPGAGVLLEKYNFIPEPEELNILMASRILRDKGVYEFIDASQMVTEVFPNAIFTLAGNIDLQNPESITRAELMDRLHDSNVNYIGYCKNIYIEICKSNIAVLPSYREGLPKFLIEAAASGRASISTFAPGCSDVIDNYKTGILVPIKNSKAIADAIIYLLENDALRYKMGEEARRKAAKLYSMKHIIDAHMNLYKN
jgi:glycosyltransferase involved in cell wall biosynthesis